MCKYVHTRVYCAKAVRDAMGHLSLKGFPAGLCLECAAWGPTTVPTGTCRPLISHRNVCFVVLPTLGKGCSGLELGRGSAYNSGRAQAIFMQPDLPLLLSLPRPRIVNDHVLEETLPCLVCSEPRGVGAELEVEAGGQA